jgi:hypothetical protein
MRGSHAFGSCSSLIEEHTRPSWPIDSEGRKQNRDRTHCSYPELDFPKTLFHRSENLNACPRNDFARLSKLRPVIYFSQKQPKYRVSTPCALRNLSKPSCLLAISLYAAWHSYLGERPTIELDLETEATFSVTQVACKGGRQATANSLERGADHNSNHWKTLPTKKGSWRWGTLPPNPNRLATLGSKKGSIGHTLLPNPIRWNTLEPKYDNEGRGAMELTQRYLRNPLHAPVGGTT